MITKKDNYNNVPVKHCSKCLDLLILELPSGNQRENSIEYCGKCGSAEIEECHISTHDLKYKELYGTSYLTKKE